MNSPCNQLSQLDFILMMDDFTPFSEVQKMFPHSPTTTWRLFDRLKLQGKLQEGADADFIKTGGVMYIRLPRFFTELEAAGYKGVVSAIKKGMQVHADEPNLKPPETSKITEDGKIKEEIKPVNSDEPSSNHLHADEFTLQPDELNLEPKDFTEAVRELQYAQKILNLRVEEIVDYKKREKREEEDEKHRRKSMESITESLNNSVKQNRMLTGLIMAPQGAGESADNEPAKPIPTVPVTEPNQEDQQDGENPSSNPIPLSGQKPHEDEEEEMPEQAIPEALFPERSLEQKTHSITVSFPERAEEGREDST